MADGRDQAGNQALWVLMISNCGHPLSQNTSMHGRLIMLSWAVAFFILAIIAAVFGFGGIAAGASSIAQILFVLFLVLFVISLITGGMRGRDPI